MNVQRHSFGWEIQVLVEGHPVHDPAFVTYMHGAWRRFFEAGFGNCRVQSSAKLMAGDVENGKPRDQMIIMPALEVDLTAILAKEN
jgi:hypothetical protein